MFIRMMIKNFNKSSLAKVGLVGSGFTTSAIIYNSFLNKTKSNTKDIGMITNFNSKKIVVDKLDNNTIIIADVSSILLKFDTLPSDLDKFNIDWISISNTIDVLRDIQYSKNLESTKSNLLYLLLNEGVVDHLLETINKNDKTSKLLEDLKEFQQIVKNFTAKNKEKIIKVIEEDIPKKAPWFQKLYKDYCISNFSKEPYGPITNSNSLLVFYYPNKDQLEAQDRQQIEESHSTRNELRS